MSSVRRSLWSDFTRALLLNLAALSGLFVHLAIGLLLLIGFMISGPLPGHEVEFDAVWIGIAALWIAVFVAFYVLWARQRWLAAMFPIASVAMLWAVAASGVPQRVTAPLLIGY